MNIETTRMAMIKRAADMAGIAKSVAQTTNPIKNTNAANTGYAIGKALAPAPARNDQAAATAKPTSAQIHHALRRSIEAGRAAYQNGQAAGQKINEYAKANPLLDWKNGTREHLGDTYTENLRRLANAWDKGVRIGEDTAAANEPQAKAIDQAIGEIQRDPRSTIQDVQNAEQNGVFSKGLNNLLLYLQNRKAQAPAVTASTAAGSTEITQ